MKSESFPNLLVCALTAIVFAATLRNVRAADLQAKTIDGQVIQGEYLGTENNIVRIKTTYGVVSIPSKNIVTLLAVNLPEKADATPSVKEEAVVVDPLVFREPSGINLSSLLAARMPRIPEAGIRSRLELFRLVRNFGDSSDASRQRIVYSLGNYGLMAFPYIEGSYTLPSDLDDKVEMLQAVTGSRRPYSAQLFSTVHAAALTELARTASEAPELPSEIITQRNHIMTREQHLRSVARNIRTIEAYAAASGGPFNALFLFNVYKNRYGRDDSDPLLRDIVTDRTRLAATCADYKNSASGWTPSDRVLMLEMAFPLYFKENDDVRSLGESILKKLLPDRHPKWDAPQAEWFDWWGKHRDPILKGK